MAIQREIIETEIRTTTTQSQAELAKLEGATGALIDKNKQLRFAMAKLEADGKKNGDSWKNLNTVYRENSNAIIQNRAKMELLRKEIGITGLSASQLTKRANELKKELNNMTKSADPVRWNKLNNELKATQGQLNNVKAGSENLKKGFSAIKSLLPAIGFAAAGAALVSFGKKVLGATDTLQDKYEKAITVAKGVTSEFFRTIAKGDFKNLLSNLLNAAKAAAEYAEIMDQVQDRSRALTVAESEFNVFKQKQLKILRNVLKTDEERIAAADAIILRENELGKTRSSIAEQALKAKLNDFIRLGITEDIVKANLLNYETNKGIIADADKYNKLLQDRSELEEIISPEMLSKSKKYAEVNARIAATDSTIVDFAKMRAKYTDLNAETLDEMARLYIEFNNAQASADENTQRTEARKNSLIEENIKSKKKETDNTIKEDKKAQDEILKKRADALKSLQQLIDDEYRSQATANEKEVEDCQRKYEAIIEQAMNAGNDIADIKALEAQRDKAVNDIIVKQNKEKNDKIQADEFAFQEKKFQALQEYNLFTADELEQMEIDMLTDLHDAGIFTEEEYQIALNAIRDKYRRIRESKNSEEYDKLVKATTEANAITEAITSQALQNISALRDNELDRQQKREDEELDALQERYDKGLISETQYNSQRKSLEDKFAKEQKEIQKKYALIELIITSASIIAKTAEAVAKSIASSPLTFGLPWSAINLGLGISEEAVAVAEYNKVNQLAKGRYNVTGANDNINYSVPWDGDMQTGVYSEPTLVADHGREMVIDSPTLRNIEINDPYLLNRIYSHRVPQYAEGNISETSSPVQQQQTLILSPLMVSTLQKLNALLEAGIAAKISYEEIQSAKETMETVQKYAGDNPIIGWTAPFVGGPVYRWTK
jgi:hypothetical protein